MNNSNNGFAKMMFPAFIIVMLLVIVSFKVSSTRWYRSMTGEDVYPISTLTDKQWVEQYKKDASYIHICGRRPCRPPAA